MNLESLLLANGTYSVAQKLRWLFDMPPVAHLSTVPQCGARLKIVREVNKAVAWKPCDWQVLHTLQQPVPDE